MLMRRILFLVVAASIITLTAGCYEPKPYYEPGGDVLAEVGGVKITVADMMESPGATMAVNQLIDDTLIMLECQARGITLDLDKFQENAEKQIMTMGGRASFEKFLEESNNTWAGFLSFIRMQTLSDQLLEDMVGEPTEEDIQAYFIEYEERYRNVGETKYNIPPEQVTAADVRQDIIEEWKRREKGEKAATFRDELKEVYMVKNYLAEAEKSDEPLSVIDLSEESPEEENKEE